MILFFLANILIFPPARGSGVWNQESGVRKPGRYQFEVLPHLLQEAVVVPLVVGGDGDTVRDLERKYQHFVKHVPAAPDLGDDVKLLDGDLVDLVEQVYAGDVVPVKICNI